MTPLERAPEGLAPGDAYLKREDTHELGAFKWRGALPTLAQYAATGADAVVTASTGNHGAATAWAAEREGVRAIVFVPEIVSETKLGLMTALGAEIRYHGIDMDEAKEEARRFAADTGLPFFEDGAEAAQFTGYGEIAHELLEQLGAPPEAVVVPVGNGALLIGIGTVLAARSPSTLRVGVVAAGAPVMADSWDAGEPVEEDASSTFADGLAVRVAIPLAVTELLIAAQRVLRVTERELAEAVAAYAAAGIRVEGAAAASLAGLRQLEPVKGPVVLIVTGRNIDDDVWQLAVDDSAAFPG